MIAELGHFFLVLAFGLALVQSVLPMVGAARGDATVMNVGRSAAFGQFAALTLAFGALATLFVTSDFSVWLVAQHSHSTKPLLFKFAGTWGNHEGSLLMWVWMLGLYGLAVAAFGRNLPPTFRARALAVQGMIGAAFLAFLLFTSNPFVRLDPAPFDGNGLNPVLQDGALAIHPPMLYLGYVGFSMAFAFAIAALIEGRVDASWARWVRPWTLVAWVALTCGIALGSYWAYYELGWGGWWFWDPVENASFMPWIAGTALLHSAVVVEKRDTLKSWTILLAILTFSLSLLGTFLVRSGVLTSVHAFAVDPERGLFILAMLVVAIGGALVLYALRAPSLKPGGTFAPASREGSLVMNNLLLGTGCATVFLGTLYPLFLQAVTGETISVGPPYFNRTFVPLMAVGLVLVPVGSMLAWKRGNLPRVLRRLGFAAAAAALVVLGGVVLQHGMHGMAVLGIALAAWVIVGSLTEFVLRLAPARAGGLDLAPTRLWQRAAGQPRGAYGMLLAHVGLGVFVAGVVSSSAWQSERIVRLQVGETAEVAGYGFELTGVGEEVGPNFVARQAQLEVTRRGHAVATLTPARRFYPVEGQATTEAAIDSGVFRDLYAVLSENEPTDGAWAFRIYHNPLVLWIFGGVGLMAMGGLVSVSDRRLRVGAPRPARHAPRAATAPAT